MKKCCVGRTRSADGTHSGFRTSNSRTSGHPPPGTRHYAAPEVLEQRRVPLADMPKVDVYALGATLFAVLHGRRMHEDCSSRTSFLRAMYAEPVLPLKHGLSRPLRGLLRRMLCLDIGTRASLEEVLAHPW